MLDYLYPRIYFSPDGDEEGGGEGERVHAAGGLVTTFRF